MSVGAGVFVFAQARTCTRHMKQVLKAAKKTKIISQSRVSVEQRCRLFGHFSKSLKRTNAMLYVRCALTSSIARAGGAGDSAVSERACNSAVTCGHI